MANGIKISVIVPIYMVEKYLKRCVESIIQQTYKNLEIILVNDGSPDKSGDLCDYYATRDDRIKVVHKKNGGLSDARNVGLQYASGDIISFVDSDDWLDLNFYEKIIEIMINHDADIVAFGYYSTDGKNIENSYLTEEVKDWDSNAALRVLCENNIISSHAWDKVYRREVLWDNLFPQGKLYEDVFVMHKIFQRAGRITFVDHPFYYYFKRFDSIVGLRTLRSYYDLIEGFQTRLSDLMESECDSYCIKQTRLWILHSVIGAYRILYDNKDNQYFLQNRKTLDTIFVNIDKDRELIKLLGINMRRDCFFLMHAQSLYGVNRTLVRNIKAIKSLIKRILKTFKRYLNLTKKKFKPLDRYVKSMGKQKHKIILLGSPEYNNLGDHAIAYATEKFIRKNFEKIQYFEITETQLENHIKRLKKLIYKDDIILLQGGGNLGNLYPDQQRLRKIVTHNFPDNKIIIMPQTCYFEEKEDTSLVVEDIRDDFKLVNKLKIFAREQYSYQTIREKLYCDCFLVPDIVLSLDIQKYSGVKNGIGLCIRSDREGNLSIAEKNWLQFISWKHSDSVEFIDTCLPYMVKKEDRNKELTCLFEKIASFRLLITDRFHGVILAALTNTPCIIISNKNYKNVGISEWLKPYPWIAFCDNIYCIEDKIIEMLSANVDTTINFEEQFAPLKMAIEEAL